MFDIGWTEMAIIAVIALLVVGPKDLPKVLRTVRGWIGKARTLAREFQSGVDDIVREAELKELKEEVEDATRDQLTGEFDDFTDPIGELMDDPEASADALEAADEPKIEPPSEESSPEESAQEEKKPDAIQTRAAKSGRKKNVEGLRKTADKTTNNRTATDKKSRVRGAATADNR